MDQADALAAGIDIGSVAVKGILLDGAGDVRRQLVETVGGSLSSAVNRLTEALLSGVTAEITLGVTEVGGHQSKWLRLGSDGRLESFSINDQCAAGSGAFLEQQAGRLKMDIDTFAKKAMVAGSPASVASPAVAGNLL